MRHSVVFNKLSRSFFNLVPLLIVVVMVAATVTSCESSGVNRALSGITKNGTLEVNSTPDNAKVYINSRYAGRTPLRVSANEGQCLVEVRKKGYQTSESWPKIRKGHLEVLEIKLEH
jgi:PEGA domain